MDTDKSQSLVENQHDEKVQAEQLQQEKLQRDVKTILSVGEEVNGADRLPALLKNKPHKRAYDGFEPSGRMHIAQGLIRTINVNKITSTGVKFVFWVADYFALLNLKMGGKFDRIRKAGELMIHIWKACGMDMSNVEFVWASEEIQKRSAEYWALVFDIATKVNVKRTLRCTQIMGRKDFTEKKEVASSTNPDDVQGGKDGNVVSVDGSASGSTDGSEEVNSIPYEDMLSSMKTSQIFYPIMQCADIFFLNIDICSLGVDQRKVNMLALEYCDMIKRKLKPIVVSHHMLSGLDGSDKMAKSNPNAAIFMDDSDKDIDSKIKQAFCEPCNITKNPVLEYFKYIVFEKEENGVTMDVFDIETKTSTSVHFPDFESLQQAFAKGHVHPSDLKASIKIYLKKYLDPVREYFAKNPEADALRNEVKKFTQK
ncbi:tyrosine-tRNA ligase [Yasminevirus sp. GU-2018]|uniref:tyrosine--tRNA ligase n=1 Tax=Yasminevirus sp. GU-2018 TaxID=2420051 RepID=A0A5K0UAW2_9VIRU|nr:tyrosine-tRNA ligase [Yasminevirus sp. GU-2018]